MDRAPGRSLAKGAASPPVAPSSHRIRRSGSGSAPLAVVLALALSVVVGMPRAQAGVTGTAAEGGETLSQSIQRRRAFPFQPRCDGNTQEMVACLWQRRDRSDLRLRTLLADDEELERWRAARLIVCRRSADRGSGGSIQPLLGLGCENALTTTLIEQISGPLLR